MLRDALKLIAVELLALAAFAAVAFAALVALDSPSPGRILLEIAAPAIGLLALVYSGAILMRHRRRRG